VMEKVKSLPMSGFESRPPSRPARKVISTLTGIFQHRNRTENLPVTTIFVGYAVVQLIEALRYKPEGRGFDSRWSH
jgi:hypothetical protein